MIPSSTWHAFSHSSKLQFNKNVSARISLPKTEVIFNGMGAPTRSDSAANFTVKDKHSNNENTVE